MALSGMGLGFEFFARDRNATSTMRKIRKETKKTSESVQELERKQKASAQQSARRGAAMVAGGVGVLAVVNKATKAFGEFEFVLASAAGKMVDGTENLKALRKAALEAGKLTQFDPQEAAQGLAELGSQGLSAKESIKALRPVLDLAAASMGQLGVGDAATVAMAALNAFGKTVDDLPDVVDKLTVVSDSSAFQMRDFQVAISQASAQAKAADQSFESMLSMLGLLKDAGNEASSAATSYRESLRRVAGDKRSIKAMKDLGVSSVDSKGQMKDLADIVAELHPRLGKLGVQQRNLALKTIFGVRGMKTYNALIASYEKQLKKGVATAGDYTKGHQILMDRLGTAHGAAAKKIDIALKTVGGQYKLMGGSWKTVVIQFGSVFAKQMLPILKALTAAMNWVVKAIDEMSPTMKTAAGFTVVFGAALVTIIGALKVLRGLMLMMSIGRLAGRFVAGQTAMATSTTATTAAVTAQNTAMATSTTRMGRFAAGAKNIAGTAAANAGMLTLAAAAAVGFGAAISDALITNVAGASDRLQTAEDKLVRFRLSYRHFNRTIRRSSDFMSTFNKKLRNQTGLMVKAASVSTKAAEKATFKITSTIGRLSLDRKKAMIGLISAVNKSDIKAATKFRKTIFETESKISALTLGKIHIQAAQYKRGIRHVKDQATFEHRMKTILLSDVMKQQKVETKFAEKRKSLEAGIAAIKDPVEQKRVQSKATAVWKKQQAQIDAGRKKITDFARRGGALPKGPSSPADWSKVVNQASKTVSGTAAAGDRLRLSLRQIQIGYKGGAIPNATPRRVGAFGEIHEAAWRSYGKGGQYASGQRSNYEAALKAGTAPALKRQPIGATRGGYQDLQDWASKWTGGLIESEKHDLTDAIRDAYKEAKVQLDITINPGDNEATVKTKTTARGGGRFKPTVRSSGGK
ncbi:hypothetical protein LCGC14_0258730 [marine sediment metagenome]|uniref:Phage tail tape measure protein domain-containing protein n=1 Tax=marine sediment metagenome TaxID=412755 RepID=A0A0F9X767_9ZZZZ